MALANVAVTLASAGRRVSVVDFDIEAPGLDTSDVLNPRKEIPGIIDFVSQYLVSIQAPDVSDYISERSRICKQSGILWIMSSGRNATYTANFHQIDWVDLYERRDGFYYLKISRHSGKRCLKRIKY